jgi:hypothetical protein
VGVWFTTGLVQAGGEVKHRGHPLLAPGKGRQGEQGLRAAGGCYARLGLHHSGRGNAEWMRWLRWGREGGDERVGGGSGGGVDNVHVTEGQRGQRGRRSPTWSPWTTMPVRAGSAAAASALPTCPCPCPCPCPWPCAAGWGEGWGGVGWAEAGAHRRAPNAVKLQMFYGHGHEFPGFPNYGILAEAGAYADHATQHAGSARHGSARLGSASHPSSHPIAFLLSCGTRPPTPPRGLRLQHVDPNATSTRARPSASPTPLQPFPTPACPLPGRANSHACPLPQHPRRHP